MKTTNYSNDTITQVLDGSTAPGSAASSGLIEVDDGSTIVGPVTSITVVGGSVIDLGDGAVEINVNGSGVPYFIASTETFTVPLYRQDLYAMEIDNQGTLEVIGFLLEVN